MSAGFGARVLGALRPTPWSQLSVPRKARRAFGALMAVSAGAMAAAAATASTDWNITSADVEKKFG